MFYDVLRTWLIAKEVIQRSAKATRENTGPPGTAEIRCRFTALFLRSSLQIASDGWVGQRSRLTSTQGLAKESQQGSGPEHNLLSGKCQAGPVRFQALPQWREGTGGLEEADSGTAARV